MKRITIPHIYIFLIACISVSNLFASEVLAAEARGGVLTVCEEPRPQICTQDYRPVCGQRMDGSVNTYSNGCSACSDKNVKNYREGVCKEKESVK